MARNKLTIDQVKQLQSTLDSKSTSTHSHTLDGLSDVVVTTPSNGQVLKFDGTNWVNGTDNSGAGGSSTFAGLTDVDLTGLQVGQTIQWNGTDWVAVNDISMHQQRFTATASQTNFTLTIGIAAVNVSIVTVNGIQQILGIDYTVSGTTLTFTYGLTLDDEIIITYFNK